MEGENAREKASLLLRNVVRPLPPFVALVMLVLLFGPATYNDFSAGRLGDAAIGSVALLLIGGGLLVWLYKRLRTVGKQIKIP